MVHAQLMFVQTIWHE